ncbi:hypothetical protein [Actinoplanes regularis]|uniref:Uncharacterized protein n=1 Tax=Actinoplanes regularis TaxID=52697 RepID=A0A239CRR3_9ACTN|nr:hypothetical protein [Actinoplanes regularis]GIE88630.1 hypothetical protein Are01nite_51100 [Actinoplanes regularis]SNS22341.1 hypothetical protein SAMN06264365_11236 [Actinoplanes regularis]
MSETSLAILVGGAVSICVLLLAGFVILQLKARTAVVVAVLVAVTGLIATLPPIVRAFQSPEATAPAPADPRPRP